MLRDLSTRTNIFRSKLIEEFRLTEGVAENTKDSPVFATDQLFGNSNFTPLTLITADGDQALFLRQLRENPTQTVKFKELQRTKDELKQRTKADRRLLRVKSQKSLPISVWARWVTTRIYCIKRFKS